MSLQWWNNAGWTNQCIEAGCQVLFWCIALTLFGKYLQNVCEGKEWYERVATHPGGKDEFIVFLRVFPQHFLSAIMIWYGIRFNNANVFRSALLAEFGYEVVDLTRVWYLYFTGSLKGPGGQVVFNYMTLHHLPGILTIIPVNVYCSDDPLFQEIPWCLLALPWINIILMTLCKCVDLDDLNERAQFMVWYSIHMAIFIYCRFVWLPFAFYDFAVARLPGFSYGVVVILVIYGVFITIFNVYLAYIMLSRQYVLMYGANEKVKKETARRLQHAVATRGLHLVFNSSFIDSGYKKPKFKRHHTTPNLFSSTKAD
eukprot:185476_1